LNQHNLSAVWFASAAELADIYAQITHLGMNLKKRENIVLLLGACQQYRK
jgi:hypothetical protein